MKFSLFKIYLYLINLFHILLNVSPTFIRTILYKIFLKKLGTGVFIDYGVYIRYPWLLEIGDNTVINRNCNFYPSLQFNKMIKIGNNVTIAYGVSLIGGTHDYSSRKFKDVGREIVIEDNVWIGANVTILPGVKIERNAVIGANSLVLKDVHHNTVVVGIPAKEINKRKKS